MMIDIYMEILILLTIGDLTIAGILGGYKALMLLFGALMSFSTRSVSENFNESKPIALAIYNVLFTACIIVPIAMLNQSDGRTLYLLAVFAVYWMTLSTLAIIFAPKVIAIYKDASGLIAQRISDSKASASEITRSAQMGRTIKELAQQPIRLMDRTTLRTYVNLLEKELTMARAALATLDANEGVLAGGGGHGYRTIAGQGQGGMGNEGGRLSAPNSRLDTTGGLGGGGVAAMTPGGTGRTSGTPRAADARTVTNSLMMVPPSANSGRPYATGNMSPKGSVPGMSRAGSTAFNKYTIGSNAPSSTSTPILAPASQNVASIPVLSSSSVAGVRSTASVAPLNNTSFGSPTAAARTVSPASINISGGGSTPVQRPHLETKALQRTSSASALENNTTTNDEFTLPPTTVPSTRFRMPGSSSLGLGGTSHAGGGSSAPLSPIAGGSSPPSGAMRINQNGTPSSGGGTMTPTGFAVILNPTEPLLSTHE
jgi:hypothetical protein